MIYKCCFNALKAKRIKLVSQMRPKTQTLGYTYVCMYVKCVCVCVYACEFQVNAYEQQHAQWVGAQQSESECEGYIGCLCCFA